MSVRRSVGPSVTLCLFRCSIGFSQVFTIFHLFLSREHATSGYGLVIPVLSFLLFLLCTPESVFRSSSRCGQCDCMSSICACPLPPHLTVPLLFSVGFSLFVSLYSLDFFSWRVLFVTLCPSVVNPNLMLVVSCRFSLSVFVCLLPGFEISVSLPFPSPSVFSPLSPFFSFLSSLPWFPLSPLGGLSPRLRFRSFSPLLRLRLLTGPPRFVSLLFFLSLCYGLLSVVRRSLCLFIFL